MAKRDFRCYFLDRALVFICHGYGEHCSRYERLGNALAEQGYLAFSQDHVGHGQSEGQRVQISDFSIYVRDVFKHIDQVTADNTGIPIFMFGHSMGGTIAVLSVMERPYFFAGAIFSAPSIKVEANPCTVIYCSTCYKYLKIIPPAVKYANDSLNWHEGMKVRWVGAILDAMNEIQRKLSKLTTPYLLVHGDGDQLVKIDGSQYLYENSPSNDKTFKVYKNGRHELLNEVEETASVVYKDILDWIQQKLP
ncbi:monoglyceride lipase-like [Porites lutea]|uniref:monoglyceride lipase-like n=1 Tax=Porites lutea TaxID=51062 RepID=UPI003CC6A55C